MDVLHTSPSRVLLLTKKHVALLRVKNITLNSTYKGLWAVPVLEITTVRGTATWMPSLLLIMTK